jgi:MYXO-CTERM domain-containing protein
MRGAPILAALLVLTARPAAAEVLTGWPCADCVTVVPGEPGATTPAPLLVALHGDGGGVRPLVRAWKRACAEAGVILLAPRCPRALGCTAGSWWQWLDTAGHDPAWLGAQIDAVTARFPVDPRRVWATGYSGGATYLGWYVPSFPTRFAAVAHVAGGVRYGGACPACKLPVLFVLGATDPMIVPYTRPLHDWYASCGEHEIVWETLRGVTHESILTTLEAGRAQQILGWLGARPAMCMEAPPAVADAGADAAEEAGALQETSVVAPSLPPPPPPPRVPPATPGCACDLEGPASGAVWPAAILLMIVARRRRQSGIRA